MPEPEISAPRATPQKAGISYSALTFRDILRFGRRQHRLILGCVAIGLVLAAAVTLVMGPVYQSDAVVVVRFGREFLYRSDIGDPSSAPIPTSTTTEELLNTLVQLLQSRDIASSTLGVLGYDRLYPELRLANGTPDTNKAVERFTRMISARPLRSSNVVQLSFQHPNPLLAQATLTALIQVFRDSSLSIYANSQADFYRRQEDLAQARLDQATGLLADFRNKNGVLAFESGLPLLLQQRGDLEGLIARGEADLAAAKERVGNLRKQAKEIPEEIVAYTDREPSRVLDDAKTKLLNLKLREQELMAQFTSDSPPIRQVRAEIKLAEHFLNQQSGEFSGTIRRARNNTLISVEENLVRGEAEQAASAARASSLRQQMALLDKQITTYSQQDAQRWSLERSVDQARLYIKQIGARAEQARLSDAANENRIGNIAVIQVPSLPDPREPVRPRWSVDLAVGAIVGLAVGGLLAVLSELGLMRREWFRFRRGARSRA